MSRTGSLCCTCVLARLSHLHGYVPALQTGSQCSIVLCHIYMEKAILSVKQTGNKTACSFLGVKSAEIDRLVLPTRHSRPTCETPPCLARSLRARTVADAHPQILRRRVRGQHHQNRDTISGGTLLVDAMASTMKSRSESYKGIIPHYYVHSASDILHSSQSVPYYSSANQPSLFSKPVK